MNTIENNLWSESIKQADLIIERGDDTFVCYRQAEADDGSAPAEQQKIWKIILFRIVTSASDKRTQVMYPNGRKSYEFAPAEIDSYTFKYGI